MFKEKVLKLNGPIVIFGSSGFVGCNLLNEILKYRKDCYAISHNPRSAWRLKLMNIDSVNILHCDITYKNSVTDLFKEINPKTVFNLSAYGAYSKQNNSNLIFETNINGTLNIIDECSNTNAVYIHAGSSSEYGLNSDSPSEDDKLLPNSLYSVSKISASYLIKFYANFHNLLCLNLRLYSIYGPWEEPDRLIPKIVENGIKNKYPQLTNPTTTRDFVYIDDCVNAFILAALNVNVLNKGKSLNIGTGVKTSLSDLAQFAKQAFQINNNPEWGSMEDRKWDTKDWVGNYTSAKKEIFWEPKTDLESGLKKTAEWQIEQNYEKLILPSFSSQLKHYKISAVIACYKDSESIPYMYDRLVKTFNKIGCNYEIIFVNDNSPDSTQDVVENICIKDLNVIGIKHSRNFGSQSAFQSGMEISTGDAVVLLDGDMQDPPELISDFFHKWQEGYKVVYGRRVKRETKFYMSFFYKLFYKIFAKMSEINIPKDAGDFSLIDRDVVEHLIALPEKDQFLRGLRAWVGFKQIGVDYVRPERMFGVTTNNFRKNIWWAKKGIFSFSYLPLEIISYLGFGLTIISFIAILIQIVSKFVQPNLPHGISTIIVLILFFGGVQLLSISVIGEYLSKVVDETKSRPKFIREKIILKGREISSINELFKIKK